MRTRTPGCRRERQRTRATLFSLAAGAAALVSAAAAQEAANPAATDPPPARNLRFELFFDADADLDLYVTGPRLETVYYGNTPSRIGGSLARDVRCDSPPGPRVETITFPAAPAGRYRVGVDFPERCNVGSGPAAFRVRVSGGEPRESSGEIERGHFALSVLEFDYAGP